MSLLSVSILNFGITQYHGLFYGGRGVKRPEHEADQPYSEAKLIHAALHPFPIHLHGVTR